MNNIKLCAFADESSPEISGQIDALCRNDIKLLEIRNVDGTNVSKISKEKAKEVTKSLNDNGIEIWSIGSPFGKINIKDDFAEHLDLFKFSLENAHIMNAKCMRIFSFFTEEYTDAVKDEVFERLNKFSEAAKGSNNVLCHENEKEIYGDIASRCLEIFKTFPTIKGIFDPANFVQCDENTLTNWEMLKDYIHYVHIKDVDASGKIVPAGTGIGNIPEILKDYSSRCGSVISLEPHLKVFDGLAELENGKKTEIEESTYASNEEAFDAATVAIKKIISEL
jgi:sugar phosphate isomerase/epimerase